MQMAIVIMKQVGKNLVNRLNENKSKRAQNPSEGEYTLCNKGEVAVFRKGKWIRPK